MGGLELRRPGTLCRRTGDGREIKQKKAEATGLG